MSLLDVRTKLICILLFTLPVFLVDKLPAAVCLLTFFVLIRLMLKIPIQVKFIKNLTLLAVFIILIQTFFGPGNFSGTDGNFTASFIPNSFPVIGGLGHWEGFFFGIVIICRLLALMLIFPVFTETTPVYEITHGLCAFGFNYRSAFVISTAFNMIPFFKKEALIIMDAQKLRGMFAFDNNRGKAFFHRFWAYSRLLLPLMLGAMRKAQCSSVAMDCRAFGIYKTRTWLKKQQMKYYDFLIILSCILFLSFILFLNYR